MERVRDLMYWQFCNFKEQILFVTRRNTGRTAIPPKSNRWRCSITNFSAQALLVQLIKCDHSSVELKMIYSSYGCYSRVKYGLIRAMWGKLKLNCQQLVINSLSGRLFFLVFFFFFFLNTVSHIGLKHRPTSPANKQTQTPNTFHTF